jgi:hypothetical protein
MKGFRIGGEANVPVYTTTMVLSFQGSSTRGQTLTVDSIQVTAVQLLAAQPRHLRLTVLLLPGYLSYTASELY